MQTENLEKAEKALQTCVQNTYGKTAAEQAYETAERNNEQTQIIADLQTPGRRSLVVQATGWGKSMLYWASTLLLRETASSPILLISPLLSLMRNQKEAAQKAGLKAEIISSENPENWEKIENQLQTNQIDILIISPERLGNQTFQNNIQPLLENTPLIVVDEIHCISDWGHDFRPDYKRIVELVSSNPNLRILGTTATANQRVIEDIEKTLTNRENTHKTYRGTLRRSSLKLRVKNNFNQAEAYTWIEHNLKKQNRSGIVYTNTIKEAQHLTRYLKLKDLDVEEYHSQLETENKENLEKRLYNNKIKAVIATSALSMGYDKPDLSFVIHLGSPSSPVAYYQQIGRAGRQIESAEVTLISQKNQEHIWTLHRTSNMLTEKEVNNLLNLTEEPKSITELAQTTGWSRNKIQNMLRQLSNQNCVQKQENLYMTGPEPYIHQTTYWEELKKQRETETEFMQQYMQSETCLMYLLENTLKSQTENQTCQNCVNCVNETELFKETSYTEADIQETYKLIRQMFEPVKLRKMWVGGLQRKGRINSIDEGYSLFFGNNETFETENMLLENWKNAKEPEKNETVTQLGQELTKMLSVWKQTWQTRPDLIVPLNAESNAETELNRRVAKHLSQVSGIETANLFRRQRAESRKQSQVQQLEEELSLQNLEQVQLKNRHVLLIGAAYTIGWNATVSGALLKENEVENIKLAAVKQVF